MKEYISIRGGSEPVDFETAILDGFATDGGLYVPQIIPEITIAQLQQWKDLKYVDLAFEILSLYIERSIISGEELKNLLKEAYSPFEREDIIPVNKLRSKRGFHIMELFHGPTLSFKDIGLAFLLNLLNFFLKRNGEHRSVIVATTGDTGPATAYFAAGKSNLDAWVLYPKELITREQERQMTTLPQRNIHPVGVSNCTDGGDDLDLVIASFYANKAFKKKMNLSSVNSINWGRIMMQTVHYFYGYFQIVDRVGERINISVPSGAFGNLCSGALARKMGLPIDTFIVANNANACLHRLFSQGMFLKESLYATTSSAIDILVPYNFWRFLYLCGIKPILIRTAMDDFNASGCVKFDPETFQTYGSGFLSHSTSDAQVLSLIYDLYKSEGYVLDPHGAVALQAAISLHEQLGNKKLICFATAHPAKFPDVINQSLRTDTLPEAAKHHSIERAISLPEKVQLFDHFQLESALMKAMERHRELTINFTN